MDSWGGLAKCPFITQALFSKSDHEGGRWGQNTQKFDHLVYEWPLIVKETQTTEKETSLNILYNSVKFIFRTRTEYILIWFRQQKKSTK